MRLHGLHLRDVKGVQERTVDFPDSGVVVIEGPNEIGKTTLLEAFDLLLDSRAKASSRSRAVKALQPVGRDVGPRVEAEFTVGNHRLRFAKQWLRGVATELDIISPVREHLSGEAAQQRLDGILAESLDRPLWDALRFTQAGELGQMSLTDSAVLTRALDGASGVDLHAADGAPLLERVEAEFLRYFTPTGRVGGELKAVLAAASAARDDAVLAHGAVSETQELVERHARLRARAAELSAREAALEDRLQRARSQDAEVSRVVSAHEESTAALAQARQDSVRAREDLSRRERAVADLAAVESRLLAARESVAQQRRELDHALEAGESLIQERDAAREARERARAVAEVAAADAEQADALDRLARLDADLERLADLRQQELRLREELQTIPAIDAAVLRKLEAAEGQVVRLRARQEASSARVTLEALGAVRAVLVNGEAIDVDTTPGSESGQVVAVRGGLSIELPDQLRVTVTPEAGGAQLAAELQEAEASWGRLLEQAGVEDIAAARDATARRSAARARVQAVGERRSDLLGGREEGALLEEVAQLRETLESPVRTRPDDYPVPEDITTARAVSRAAARARTEAEAALEEAVTRLRQHEQQGERRALAVERSQAVIETLNERLTTDRARLIESQQATPDDMLRERVAAAEARHAQVEARAAVTGRELDETDVAGVRARVGEAEQAQAEHAEQVRSIRHEQAQVHGQVELVSGEGRQETYDLALGEFLRLRQELEVVHRRARAARQLRETLGRHRETAHRAYVRPYREEICRLGRLVYDDGFDVDIDDDLTIASRTLAGTTVAFEQLSGGAKEQLGILARLAVASLVDRAAGVPVIIDDALGYTDPDRLDRVSAVFTGPGQNTQVVLLTCTPERYQGIPGATTIRLTA